MADQELTDLAVLTTLATSDLFFVRDVSTGIDKQLAASTLSSFIGAPSSIDDLTDVDTTTSAPSVGDVLTWDGISNWIPGAGIAAPHALTHESPTAGGTDPIDGDHLDISFIPTFYTPAPAVPPFTTAPVQLTSHLAALDLLFAPGGHTHVEADITDLKAYLLTEVNDLTAAVTWADVPDANITESSVTQHEAAIDHDALLNFVANEHIDHSAVVLTAGIGLSGGGDITASRTFDLDIPGLVNDGSPAGTYTFAAFDGSAHKEVAIQDIPITESQITDLSHKVSVQDEGSPITATPHTTLNFVGAGVVAADATGGVATITIPGGGVATFVGLADTPASYVAAGSGFVKVNAGATALEFVADPGFLTTEVNDLSAAVTWANVPDANITESSVTQHEAAIDHDALLNFAGSRHVDHTAVTITAGVGLSGGGDISASRTVDMDIPGLFTDATPGGSDFVVTYNGSAHQKVTLSNLLAVTHTHDAGDIVSGTFVDARVSVSNVTQHVGSIDHDLLLNFVANKHVDHSAVILTAGVGLTGGGDITASRTFDLDIPGLVDDASPAGSYTLAVFDGSAHKEVTLANLLAVSHTHDAGDIISGIFVDARVGVTNVTQHVGSIDHNLLLNYVADEHVNHSAVILTAGVALVGGGDITASRTIDVDITTLTVDLAPDGSADFVMTYDSSASAHKRVLIDDLPGGGGGGGSPQDPLSVVQARRTTTVSPGGSFTAVSFDVTDVENNSSCLDHTATRITIKETGPVLVYFGSVVDGTATSVTEAQVRLNGSTVIPGSYQKFSALTAGSAGDLDNVFTFVASADDYIELEVKDAGVSPATLAVNAFFGATKLTGVKGLDWTGPWMTATSYQVDDAVENGGVAYICIADHTSGSTNEPDTGASYATFWQVLAKAGPNLEDLDDVVITSVAAGELIKWDGANWINNTLGEAGIAPASHTHVEADITDLQAYLLDITSEFIGDLSDVTLIAAVDGELLRYNGTIWINNTLVEAGVAAASHTHVEADITDLQAYLLDITGENFTDLSDTPANYTAAANQFVRVNAGETALEFFADPGFLTDITGQPLSDLSDVTITSVASGELLTFTGSIWENQTLAEAGVAAASHTHVEADITDLQTYALASVTLTAGIGLVGGGDLSASRTFDLDIPSLTDDFTPTGSYSIAAFDGTSTHKQVLLSTIPTTESQITDLQAYLLDITGEDFTDLSDTPVNYVGAGTKFVRVNAGATALEFVALSLSDLPAIAFDDLSDVVITSIASDEIVKFDGANWINNTLAEAGVAAASHTHVEADITDLQAYLLPTDSIDDLSDVDTTTAAPSVGEHLEWDGSNWVPGAAGGGTFLSLSDTPGSFAASGTFFVRVNAGATALEFVADPGYLTDITAEALGDLSDVTITSVASGELFAFTGSIWENQTLAEVGVAPAIHTHVEADITDLAHVISLEDEGIAVTGTPHAVLNFVGSGVAVTDAGSGEATITISGTGTSANHDAQTATSTTTTSTNNGSYVDMPGMTLTTKDLGETGTYVLTFSAYANNQKKERTARYRLVVGGVAQDEYLHSSQSKASDETVFSFTRVLTGVASGTIIKVQFLVDDTSGNVNVFNKALTILGIPDSQVIA